MDELDRAAVSYQIVLTKADKVKPRGARGGRRRRPARRSAGARPRIPVVLATSSEKGDGLDALRGEIAAFSIVAISR